MLFQILILKSWKRIKISTTGAHKSFTTLTPSQTGFYYNPIKANLPDMNSKTNGCQRLVVWIHNT